MIHIMNSFLSPIHTRKEMFGFFLEINNNDVSAWLGFMIDKDTTT